MDIEKLFNEAEEKVRPQAVAQAWEGAKQGFFQAFTSMKAEGVPEECLLPIAIDTWAQKSGIHMPALISSYFTEWKAKNP